MSKLPNHTLWARTTSAAASSSRSVPSVLVTSRRKYASDSNTGHLGTTNSSTSIQSSPDAATLAALGAVTAPFYGPQPAGVVELYDQQRSTLLPAHDEITTSSASSLISMANFNVPISFSSLLSSSTSNASATSPFLRHVFQSTPVSPHAARALHMWAPVPTQTHLQGAPVPASTATEDGLPLIRSSQRPRRRRTKLLFDAADSSSRQPQSREPADRRTAADALDDVLAAAFMERTVASLEKGSMPASDHFGAQIDRLGDKAWAEHFFSQNNVSPPESPSHSPSRSPSPGPSRDGSQNQIGHQIPSSHVNGPKPKFAVTTTAGSDLTTAFSGDGGAEQAAKLQYLASTSSAAPPNGMPSSLPPQASSSSGSTEHWAKTFRLPRSTQHHEYMFEHGAYGIPKRHPLSAVRSASANAGRSKERSGPSKDVVPSSKVRAAADILAAAAEFFAGPQSGPMPVKSDFRPFRGSDALQAALAGGSTAEGYELRSTPRRGKDGKPDGAGLHRMAIRGPDGRIIKDRLRSVQVGEDAYFLRPDALGVADGVGGWASRPGADPALFSRLLMHFCAVELSRYDGLSASELAADNGSLLKAWAAVDPVEVMHRAWERCVRASRREGILGSSTALIGILRGEELRIANMGDCVLMIIRGGEMMFRSTEQQHSFNFPVQLGMMGDTTDTIKKHVLANQSRERAAGEGEVASGALEDYDAVEEETMEDGKGQGINGASATDQAHERTGTRHDTTPPVTPDRQGEEGVEPDWDEPRRDAGRWTVRVKAGDIIVVGSDGLMDNLFDEDIIEEVVRFLPADPNAVDGEPFAKVDSSNFSPQLVSEALCSRAKAVSEDSRAISSPFQQRAMEEGLNYVGGKHDDISVLVCLVGERDGLVMEAEGQATVKNDEKTQPEKEQDGAHA